MNLEPKIQIEDLFILYSDGVESLRGITLDLYARQINVLFGPAGGGNRTRDQQPAGNHQREGRPAQGPVHAAG